MNYSWAIDQRKCIGCHACTTACKSENEVPLSVDRTWVKYVEKGTYPNAQRHFGVLRCNHCAKPPCVDICPVTAMFKREDGIVEFDKDVCIGCKGCIAACPYDAIYIDPEEGTAAKCNFCSHRLDVGLEPACVVVCPEEALVFGDLDDPTSTISRLVGREKTQVRKPEKNTEPNCFYIGADEAVLNPDMQSHDPSGLYMWSEQREHHHGAELDNNVSSAQSASGLSLSSALHSVTGAKVAYDVPHAAPWGTDVSMYLWTKSVSAGVVMVGWFVLLLSIAKSGAEWLNWFCPLTALVFLGLTGVLLIKDLDRPERFYTILTRPQWKSWLAIGAYIILFYSLSLCASLALYFTVGGGFYDLFFHLNAPLAFMTAIYTAFLFAQAKARDLWQSPLLPVNLFLQAVTAGSATLLISLPFFGADPGLTRGLSVILGLSIVTKLLVIIFGELMVEHASKAQARAVNLMVKGQYKELFWGAYVISGSVVPSTLLLLMATNTLHNCDLLYPLCSLLALIGLYAYEHCFVMAGQSIRLS